MSFRLSSISLPLRRYASSSRDVIFISADAFGNKLIEDNIKLLKKLGVPLNPVVHTAPSDLLRDRKRFDEIIASVKQAGVAVKTPWITPTDETSTSINVEFRNRLDLFANVVRVKSYESISNRNDVDFILVRQNTEGEYSLIEHENVPGVVEMFKVVTKQRSEQIARFAFDHAKLFNRRKVTCIHKANIMKLGDGLFLDVFRNTAKQYPELTVNDLIVDNCCMQLVQKPQQFDVVLTPNLYGNIIVNIGAALIGGEGILSGVNYSMNNETAVFEVATRSASVEASSSQFANPMGFTFAICQMLEHLQLEQYADIIRSAVRTIVVDGRCRFKDFGGITTTDQFFVELHREVSSYKF